MTRAYSDEGLQVQLVSFAGEAALAQALASGSVDLGAASLTVAVQTISAGHPVRAFYIGSARPDYEWFARPGITSWTQLRGGRLGVTVPGGLTDLLSRHVLRQQGLEPGRDVHIAPSGGSAARLAALRAGRLDATVLPAPFRWQAEAEGFGRLGTQAALVGQEWPFVVFTARLSLLDGAPAAVRAFLRAHVRAIRQARARPEEAVEALVRELKLERPLAHRAYAEVVETLDERGSLPAAGFPAFWELSRVAGDVDEPWPETRFLDRRFLSTFDQWAPPR
jgi:NitT/TauT family transport system substrate-binding protein